LIVRERCRTSVKRASRMVVERRGIACLQRIRRSESLLGGFGNGQPRPPRICFQEGGSGQERGDTERHNGMTPYGVVIEQTIPSAGFAG